MVPNTVLPTDVTVIGIIGEWRTAIKLFVRMRGKKF